MKKLSQLRPAGKSPMLAAHFPFQEFTMSQGFPQRRARMEYVCMNCGHRHPVDSLLYTCPDCGGVLLLEDLDFDEMKEKAPSTGVTFSMPAAPPAATLCAASSASMS